MPKSERLLLQVAESTGLTDFGVPTFHVSFPTGQ